MMGVFVQVNEGSHMAKSNPIGYVIQENGCWDWVGTVNPNGYGLFWNGQRVVPAHRWTYERTKGPIPKGLQLDHLCRNRKCVNPDHLEAVSHKENCLRGVGVGAVNAAKTHCKYGHAFTPENTRHIAQPRGPQRLCRTCKRNRERKKKALQ